MYRLAGAFWDGGWATGYAATAFSSRLVSCPNDPIFCAALNALRLAYVTHWPAAPCAWPAWQVWADRSRADRECLEQVNSDEI